MRVKSANVLGILLLGLTVPVWAQPAVSTNTDALREKLFQRFLAETGDGITTNRNLAYTNMVRMWFNMYLVDPTFGLHWDEVPAPTLTNVSAMDDVVAFIKTNGWNMATNDIFGEFTRTSPRKTIRGLPWAVIKDREFDAVTSDGIFYVIFNAWHHGLDGVAYNPTTNIFTSRISSFKPIGGHWYVWAATEDPVSVVQLYEGKSPRTNAISAPDIKVTPSPPTK